jgi:Protein of unknown function C-terminus (DUF2399)
MVQQVATVAVPLEGVPDGLRAFPIEQVTADGAVGRTRRRRIKLELVELRAANAVAADPTMTQTEEAFVLGAARRRWSTVEGRFGSEAWPTAVRLAFIGAVRLRCRVEGGSRLGAPIDWLLAPEWSDERLRRRAAHATGADWWFARAQAAASAVDAVSPQIATALRASRAPSTTLEVLVFAAEDLAAGVSHAGPRAFSQVHFGETKVRDDVVGILRDACVPDDVIVTLGLRRSDRIGVAGPVAVQVGTDLVHVGALDGPVLLRTDQPDLMLSLEARCPLVVVENLQAAESIADRFRSCAVFYTAGLLGARALDLLSGVVADADQVVIAVDSDAGGVRIAEQALGVAPGARLLDAGQYEHTPRPPFAPDGVAMSTLRNALNGRAASLAAACLQRGYPVEQEAAIVQSVADALQQCEVGPLSPGPN